MASIEKKLTIRDVFIAFFLSQMLFIANEFLFYEKGISIFISIMVFIVVVYLLLKEKFDLLLKFFLCLFFLIATRPRELHLVLIEDRGNFSYYSPNILKLIGASTSTLSLFIAMSFLLLFYVFKKRRINKIALYPFFFLLIVTIYTVFSSLFDELFNFSYFLIDFKYLLFIAAGVLVVIAADYNYEKLIYDIVYISIVLSFMFAAHFLKDLYTGELLLKYNHSSYISSIGLALVLTTDVIRNRLKMFVLPLLVIGAIPITRGEQLIFIISMLISLYYMGVHRKTKSDLLIVALLLTTAFVSISYIISLDNTLSDFLLRKFEFFSSADVTVDKSSSIRVVEFLTILSSSGSYNPLSILFGGGFGETFSFDYSFTSRLDLADFNQEEIESNRFLIPHLFISYWLLKFGVIGTLFLSSLHLKYFKMSKDYRLVYLIFIPSLLWQAYWSPGYAFLTGVLFGCSILIKDSSNNA